MLTIFHESDNVCYRTHDLRSKPRSWQTFSLILAATCIVGTYAYAGGRLQQTGREGAKRILHVSDVGRGARGAAKMFLHATQNPGRGVETRGKRWRGITLDHGEAQLTMLSESRRNGSTVFYGFDGAGDLRAVQHRSSSGATRSYEGAELRSLLGRLNASGSSWHGGFRTYEPMAGEYITTAIEKMVGQAREVDRTAVGTFNGVTLVAHPASTTDELRQVFDTHFSSQRPNRSAERRREKRRRREATKQVLRERELASGMGELKLANHKGWAKSRKVNSHGYGKAILDYAERWARLLQGAIDRAGINDARKQNKGEVARIINEHAERLSQVADTEGITGFMYGAAVATLAKTWKHGDALRRWHNLSTQAHGEGVEANRGSGVLNPALLRTR